MGIVIDITFVCTCYLESKQAFLDSSHPKGQRAWTVRTTLSFSKVCRFLELPVPLKTLSPMIPVLCEYFMEKEKTRQNRYAGDHEPQRWQLVSPITSGLSESC